MAGIYLHIPFCKKACHYCNFHFSTSLGQKDLLLEALIKELDLRRDYLVQETIQSIYFGGGTPSLLSRAELEQIFAAIHRQYIVAEDAEITLEANPDDLTPDYLQELKDSPVNRLSIGVQSFSGEDLIFMNRAHNAEQAFQCLELARKAGFEQITADLIYGSPTTSDEQWARNIQLMLEFEVPHLSCYCLTVEPGTALDHFVRKGQAQPVDEVKAARQFEYLMDTLVGKGFLHYEISNFARPGFLARHNSSYWKSVSYLGIGPSAHSYNGHSRQWNVAHNAKYIKAIREERPFYEVEKLTPADQYNEYVMTGLRTMWGVKLEHIQQIRPEFTTHFERAIQPLLAQEKINYSEGVYRLTKAGKLMADRIAADLFWIES